MITRCLPFVDLQPPNPRRGSINCIATASRATMPASGRTQFVAITDGDPKRKIMEVYSTLKSELLHDSAFEFTNESRQWINQMVDYNVPRGRLNRIFSVISCYQVLQDGKESSDEESVLACVLGWCVEWLHAFGLVVDDIMDNSYTRRGRPCWFRLPQVGMIAVNDAALLQAHIFRILKKHFRDKPYYVQLFDLFNEVGFQTMSGQMLDVTTPLVRENDLSKYSMELYRWIAKYKTAYYSLYLPVACALILAGERLDDHLEVKDILVEMMNYYQIQDDHLDCFGDPNMTGKVGTDIEDAKCSWFIVKALELSNEEQKKILWENYGKSDPMCIDKVKKIYAILDLQNVYTQYQKRSFEELKKSIEMHPSNVVQAIWRTFMERMMNKIDESPQSVWGHSYC